MVLIRIKLKQLYKSERERKAIKTKKKNRDMGKIV